MATRVEVRDGREYTVTVLPRDSRLAPSAAKRRALPKIRGPLLCGHCQKPLVYKKGKLQGVVRGDWVRCRNCVRRWKKGHQQKDAA